jgi:protein O-mannosyl-transferase
MNFNNPARICFFSCIILLSIITFFAYFNSLFNNFAFDDIQIIRENIFIKNIKNILEVFNPTTYSTKFNEFSFRPIATISYILTSFFWKNNPLGFHLSNIIFHIFNVILVFLLARKFFKNDIYSFISAIIFALSPIISETIFCASYNEDIFSCLFLLLAFLSYLKNSRLSFIFCSIFLFLSLLSKEVALIFPLLIIFYELLFTNSIEKIDESFFKRKLSVFKSKFKYYLLILIVIIIYSILRFALFHNSSHIESQSSSHLFERIIYIPYNIFKYIKMTLFPLNLNADYIFSYPSNFFEIENIFALLTLIFIFLITFFFYKVNKPITFGIIWFLISLLPVLNIIIIYNPIAERYLYIPIIGFAIFISGLLSLIPDKKNEKYIFPVIIIKSALILVILSFYSIILFGRANDWKDDEHLWKQTIKVSPKSYKAYNGIGLIYLEKKDFNNAKECFEKSISINGKFSTSYNNLGCFYFELNQNDKAIDCFKKSIEIAPDENIGYTNLGIVYNRLEMYDDALLQFKKSFDINPYFDRALFNAGIAFYAKKDYKWAEFCFIKTIESNSGFIEAFVNLGGVYAKTGRLQDAIFVWEKGLEISPNDQKLLNNLEKAKKRLYK